MSPTVQATKTEARDKNRVVIFDTTMRDGEQAPGGSMNMEPEAVHQATIDCVGHARNLCDDVEWSAQDASRTEHDFLCRCVESAIKAGAGTVNIPDTLGYALPEE